MLAGENLYIGNWKSNPSFILPSGLPIVFYGLFSLFQHRSPAPTIWNFFCMIYDCGNGVTVLPKTKEREIQGESESVVGGKREK